MIKTRKILGCIFITGLITISTSCSGGKSLSEGKKAIEEISTEIADRKGFEVVAKELDEEYKSDMILKVDNEGDVYLEYKDEYLELEYYYRDNEVTI